MAMIPLRGIEVSRSQVRQQLSSSVKKALAQHCILSCGIDVRSSIAFRLSARVELPLWSKNTERQGRWALCA